MYLYKYYSIEIIHQKEKNIYDTNKNICGNNLHFNKQIYNIIGGNWIIIKH